jgi:DNA-binding response OmpR family regulator
VKIKNNEATVSANYTITLDADPKLHLLNAEILGLPSIPFTSPQNLRDNLHQLRPVAAFVEISLGMDGNGGSVLTSLKSLWPQMPLIAISNTADDDSVADALLAGADDFIRKPYSSLELIARFNARRKQLARMAQTDCLAVGDSTLNLATRELLGPLGKMYLSPTEVGILKSLVESEGQLVPRDALKQKCWGDQAVTDNALDRHIHGVRAALKNVSANMKMRAVYGRGYLVQHLTKEISLAS